MIKYIFRLDEPLRIKAAKDANPQTIGTALAAIAESAKGELTPLAVVNSARPKNSPLHKHFEWDDALAAEAHRLDQARNLIRIVSVKDASTEEGMTRAFQSIASKSGTSYRHIEEIKSSVELQLALLRQAEGDLQAFEKRYRSLTDVCGLVQQAMHKVREKRGKLEGRSAAA